MSLDDLRIETPRLILRVPRAGDLDPWAEMMVDEQVAQFIGGVTARSVSWRALMSLIGAWHAMGFAMFSVIEKNSDRWVGRLGPWMPDGWPGTEVGWAIAREYWGRGYATEGAAAATGWGLLLAAVARTPAQVGSLGSALMLLFGILGGSFVPTGNFPGWLQALSRVTPNAWGLDGFTALARGGSFGSLALPLAALSLMAGLLFAAAVLVFRRSGLTRAA